MKTIPAIATRACIIAALCFLGACSHGDSASNAQSQTDVQSAAASDAPTAAPSGSCTLIDNASVEKAMHDRVATVKVDHDSCEFGFKTLWTDLTVEFDAQGGAHELDILRQTVGTATGALNSAASAAPNGQMAAGVVTASTPRGIPKLGDDQFASGPSPALFLGVRRGDAYVQISGAAMPDNLDAWEAAADLVRETFANQH